MNNVDLTSGSRCLFHISGRSLQCRYSVRVRTKAPLALSSPTWEGFQDGGVNTLRFLGCKPVNICYNASGKRNQLVLWIFRRRKKRAVSLHVARLFNSSLILTNNRTINRDILMRCKGNKAQGVLLEERDQLWCRYNNLRVASDLQLLMNSL